MSSLDRRFDGRRHNHTITAQLVGELICICHQLMIINGSDPTSYQLNRVNESLSIVNY
ncbi:hypothetical protein NIES39_O01800 [Arthrospira platensis NIES-39]|nr:hypothetical protein NIES39_O01800 [Arthrospira platensis NIES-39]